MWHDHPGHRHRQHRPPRLAAASASPHGPDTGGPFLDTYPFIDIAVHGEGEATFLAVLEACGRPSTALRASSGFDGVGGITRRGTDGRPVTTPKPPRLKDLDTIPSPY